jgi:hypothetical protein
MTVRTKEEIREYNQQYYQKNKEKYKESHRRWRKNNPEKWRALCYKNRQKRIERLNKEDKDKILNEITSFCNECASKDCCPESDCVLFRIEQIVLEKVVD